MSFRHEFCYFCQIGSIQSRTRIIVILVFELVSSRNVKQFFEKWKSYSLLTGMNAKVRFYTHIGRLEPE